MGCVNPKRLLHNCISSSNNNINSNNNISAYSTMTLFKRELLDINLPNHQKHLRLPNVINASTKEQSESNCTSRINKAKTVNESKRVKTCCTLSLSKKDVGPLLREHPKEIRDMIEEKCKTGINKGRKLSNEISGRSVSKRKVKKIIKTKQNTEYNQRNKNNLLTSNHKRHMIKAKILHTLPIKEMSDQHSLTDKFNSLLKYATNHTLTYVDDGVIADVTVKKIYADKFYPYK